MDTTIPTIKRQFFEVKTSSHKNNYDNLKSSIKSYEGDITNLVKLRAKDSLAVAGWNRSLIHPIEFAEVVCVHPDQTGIDPVYVKVIHSIQNVVSVFHRAHFDDPSA